MQIRFTTRSGTNRYQGSAYFYYQDDRFNANTWFNKRDGLPTPVVTLNQPGFRLGGPIGIPKLFDGRNKAFFFFNYEEAEAAAHAHAQPDPRADAVAAGHLLYNGTGRTGR